MSKKAKKVDNFGLPDGFVLDWDVISHQDLIGSDGDKADLDHVHDNFDQYVNEELIEIDCGSLIKEELGLSKKPHGYQYSLIVFKVLSEEDMRKLQRTYPERYQPLESRGTVEERFNSTLISLELIESDEWRQLIEYSISLFFNSKQYKKPVPILVRYGRCGYWYTSSQKPWHYSKNGGLIINRKPELFEHTPWEDEEYHKVFAYSPIRLRNNLRMTEFLSSVATKVNEYFEEEFFDSKELIENWHLFKIVDSVLRETGTVKVDVFKKEFNLKISTYYNSKVLSPQHGFYLKHFVDCLDELQDKKILKRCEYCYKAFDWHDRKVFCTEKCRRSKNRRLDYYKNIVKRRDKSRLEMQDTRRYYKEMGVKK